MSSLSSCSSSNDEAQQVMSNLKRQLNNANYTIKKHRQEKAVCRKKALEHNEMFNKFKEEKHLKTAAWSTIDKIKSRKDAKNSRTQSMTNENVQLKKSLGNQSNQFKKSLDIIGYEHESDVNCYENHIDKFEKDAEVESQRNEKKHKKSE